jgi:hypothetical protein
VNARSPRERRGRYVVSTDPFDVELEDVELLDEVGLTAGLMVAANQSEGPLSREEIDRLLGLA